jgi:hypothetical protein
VSLEDCSATLHVVYLSLDRFFQWLSASLQSFKSPTPFDIHSSCSAQSDSLEDAAAVAPGRNSPVDPPLYGWCSDRVFEDGRIHSWVTAAAIEFLVEFRRLAQERINSQLRANFLSYHPEELKTLTDVDPTDLANLANVGPTTPDNAADDVLGENAPVILQLLHLLRDHKLLELKEGPWLPTAPQQPKISLWSSIFYGPPGTSKTFLANAIAGELKWPLISLSPSDFLTKGATNIEARASEIFTALSSGSRLVYFFDEIDELIRDRRRAEVEQTNAFSFLTPSFLTKLQDFRKDAKDNEFIFILATNYYDRIDSAAKRSGRIDRNFLIVYPDCESRASLLLQHLMSGKGDAEAKLGAMRRYLQPIQQELDQKYHQHENDRPRSTAAVGSRLKCWSVADLCATFIGSLSHQKIQEFLKLRFPKPFDETPDRKKLLLDLFEMSEGKSSQFKPEMDLTHYSLRLEARSEIMAVARVYPRYRFPPYLTQAEQHPQHLVRKQIEGLRSQLSEKRNTSLYDELVAGVTVLGFEDH